MATIFDIESWTITDENITGNVGNTNLTLVSTDFHDVATVEVSAPADFAVIDIGVIGLGSSGGGSGAVDSVNGETGVVVLNQDEVLDGTTHKQYSATEKTKLAGIATGATANDTDANLKNRANHTGSQAISTVTNLQTTLDGKAASSHTHAESDITGLTTDLAGKQPLDSDLTAIAGLSPTNDDFVQRKAGAWTNRTPAQVKTDLALTKSDVGLANVDNTSDANKPVSSATQTALDGKQPLDADLTAIAALAPADDAIIQRKSSAWVGRTMSQLKTDLALVKGDVGLGNVDNTSDANKPISTAQQTAFDARFVWADGTNASNARPSTSSKVIWVGGTTQPTNMANGDLWVKA